ncbi:MAG: hypothetical protein PVJ54_15410 [Desulfobacterales bacterium]
MQVKKHKNKKPSGPPTITGIILPSRGSEKGKPARIALHTDDQHEYEIDFSGAGKELLNLAYKKVVVQGKLREQLSGRATLSVRQYQIIKDETEDNVAHLQEV